MDISEAQIKFEYDNEFSGWTDNAIMLNCGDRSLEQEIKDTAKEMADLYLTTKSLVEFIAGFYNIYKNDDVVPQEVYRLTREALRELEMSWEE